MIKLNGQMVEPCNFPDNTQLFMTTSLPNIYTYGKVDEHIDITWHYENDEEMITLMYITRHLQSNGAKDIDLIMPYIPNARMDRVKWHTDVFTLKYFADFINFLGFNSVTVLDPHSYVSEALINNIRIRHPKFYILDVINNIRENIDSSLLMFYPDEGATKRYSELLDKPYAFGIKKRDWVTGKIEGLDVAGCVDKIKDSSILIIDDICSRGGTFYHSAKKLKELGAENIYLYVTHCENTILNGELLTSGLIEKVYTTNSIFTKEHEKIEVFEI